MESTVVWSSMSRVTVVPARVAAAQIAAACSRAIRSPSPGSAWPSAESLTDTSTACARPRSASAVEQRDVRDAGGRGVDRVGDVLAEVVDGDQQPALDQRADRRHRGVEVVARDEATDETAGRGWVVTRRRTRGWWETASTDELNTGDLRAAG